MMTQDPMEWLGEAARGLLCEVSACTANPVTTINGRALCAWHRDVRNAVSGPACGNCGNTMWAPYLDGAHPHVTCTACERPYYHTEWLEER